MKWLKRAKRNEKGDIAIEALLGLIFFILSVMAVLMFSMIMRLEATTQYATDQVAKEVAQYFYIAEKAGVLPDAPASSTNTDQLNENFQKGQEAIQQFEKLYESSSELDVSSMNSWKNVGNNAQSAISAASSLKSSLQNTDWKSQLTILMNATMRSGAQRLLGCAVADPVCSALFPKYMSVSDLDAYLKANGVEEGKSGLHFEQSMFLADGYSINVVLNYRINLKAMTFGMYDGNLYVQQTACTAAWIHYRGVQETPQPGKTLWDNENDMMRGKQIVSKLEEGGQYGKAIKKGLGFDTYDESNNRLTKIESMNILKNKITSENEAGERVLNESELKNRLSRSINLLKTNKKKAEQDGVHMESDNAEKKMNGDTQYQLVVAMPKDAEKYSDQIQKCVENLAKEKGLSAEHIEVKVIYEEFPVES